MGLRPLHWHEQRGSTRQSGEDHKRVVKLYEVVVETKKDGKRRAERRIKGSGEEATFSATEMAAMLELGKKGIRELCELQQKALEDFRKTPPAGSEVDDLASHFNRR